MIMKYLSNCFKRALLYQVLIAFSVLRLMEAWRFHRDFMSKVQGFLSSIKLDPKLASYLPRDSEITYKGFLIGLIVFAGLSILGIGLCEFIAGIACLLVAFLYYNPIVELQKKTITAPKDYLPSIEFCLFVALGLAMMTNAFCSCCSDKCVDEVKPKDVEIEIASQDKRTKSPSSNDKKKKKML